MRMRGARRGQPAVNEPPQSVTGHPAVLTTARQCAMPEPTHLGPKQEERRAVHGNSVVSEVSPDHRAQPFALFRDGTVHAPPELGFHLAQLGLQPRPYRLPQHRKPSVTSLLPADMREAEEVEGLGLSLTTPLSVFSRKRAEFQEAGLVGVQFQPELSQPFCKLLPEPLGIRPVLESEH